MHDAGDSNGYEYVHVLVAYWSERDELELQRTYAALCIHIFTRISSKDRDRDVFVPNRLDKIHIHIHRAHIETSTQSV